MQETTDENPGRCFAVHARPGDVVIVPPNWAHATISASPDQPLTFGAWCDRAYGFEYDGVRARSGLAWFPLLNTNNQIVWVKNNKYKSPGLIEKAPEKYKRLGITEGVSIYRQFEENPDKFLFVPHPREAKDAWENFIP
jgi:glucose-6-phosphate isomerase, archaeal